MNNKKAVLWTLAVALCFSVAAYFAGCGSDSATDAGTGGGGDSGGGGNAEIDKAYADWKCDTNPTDACGQAICNLLKAAKAMGSAYTGISDCVTTLASCYQTACTDPANPDAAALQTCGCDYQSCICAIPAYKQAAGSACTTGC
jgi:hypothetical protein